MCRDLWFIILKRLVVNYTKLTIIILIVVILVSSILSIGVYLFCKVGWDGMTTKSQRELWRNKTRSVISDLRLGMSERDVRDVLRKNNYGPQNKYGWPVDGSADEGEMRLRTPVEMGANNWLTILTFEDGYLAAIKVRTEDSILYRPEDAPPDIVR